MKHLRWLALAAILLAAAAVQAGTIHPALQAQMDRTAPNTPISVIVNLTEQAPLARMNQELTLQKATRQERHRVVVTALQDAAARSQAPLKAYLDERMRAGDVLGYTAYWISNLMVVQATKDAIVRIAARSDVDVVEQNFHAELIEPVNVQRAIPSNKEDGPAGTRGIGVPPGIRAVHAPQCWYQLGVTGAGALIGGMDTGVLGTHVALATRWRGYQGQHPWQECWLDVLNTPPTNFPSDTYGHGTHTMGTMTGLAPDDSIGVAPGAQWISCNAINQGTGNEFDNDVIHGFQWFADPDGNPNTVDDVPDVIQNSWGVNSSFPGYHTCDNRWWSVLDGCSAAGIIVTWSAGNEGPGAQTMRSPADRATTLYEAFSVGAVDATNYGWPYPIASFSSRGPTGCVVPPPNQIKPEVAAPGVHVYSSYNDGGYTYMDGTSMAGPHAAGIMALMRQANPNLSVDDAKQILMTTARDEGNTGEDNTFGWGFVDAYAAVQGAMTGFGVLDGHVTNASWQNQPLAGAHVKVILLNRDFVTDGTGYYHGSVPPGVYRIAASRDGFRPDTTTVTVIANQTTTQDFSLVDIGGPTITNVTDNRSTNDTSHPYPIQATIDDPSTVASAVLYYRLNAGPWNQLSMTPAGDVYSASIPAMPHGTRIDYYVWAQDGVHNAATSPANAPAAFYSLFITELFYSYQCEDPGDPNWQLGAQGDQATTGIWIRDVPVASYSDAGVCVQPDSDHTPDPGVKCFVTGNAAPGAPGGTNDVDGGCTTLLSPIWDLSGRQMAFITYWRWWAEAGSSADDTMRVDVSGDGGNSWMPLERWPSNDNVWRKITLPLQDVIPLTSQVRVRFVACDLGQPGIIEMLVDDVSIDTFTANPGAAPDASGLPVRTELLQSRPNPAGPVTTIHFRLSNAGHARVEIFDASGRLVRTLVDADLAAGNHQAVWNSLDDQGRQVGSGVYFYHLKAGAYEQSRRMTILR